MSRPIASVIRDVRETGEMIAFKHTVFALPFAVISLITATAPSWPSARVWLWVLVAMVSARTAAMAFNRLADHTVDSRNPRTCSRALPAGRLDRRFTWMVTVLAGGLFLVAAGALNPMCLALAPPTLAILLGYSFSKRFTAASHFWLGCSLGLAPIGAWIAATGALDPTPIILGGAVCFWVAGFDIIYSLQDEDFDRSQGLHSVPARLGGRRALVVARLCHLLALAGFVAFAVDAGGGVLRLSAIILAGALLAWQHRAISTDDLSAVDAAFFSANGTLAVVMGLFFFAAQVVAP